MDCCSQSRGINRLFNKRTAEAELRQYARRGLDRHAQRIVDALAARGITDQSVLEVGAGIGGLHTTLLQRGASNAIDVDIASAYIAAAQRLAEQNGLRDRVTYHEADFASIADSLPPADIVVMHRVVCCYPDMPALIRAAAEHANRLLALSFPQSAWYMRLARRVLNAGMWLQRSGYRFYVHNPQEIERVAVSAGLRPVQSIGTWPWQIALFERS